MGEAYSTFSFNGSVRIEGRSDQLTANAGALALREVDERLGLTRYLAKRLEDDRATDRVTHSASQLVRTRLYAMALGHRRQDDLDDLRFDPAFRAAVSDRRGVGHLAPETGGLASQPSMSRMVARLASTANQAVLAESLVESARRDLAAHGRAPLREAILDVDSFALQVHGHQAGSAYNGHYGLRCYHPIVTFLGETGHCLAADLRPGNVHTANGATSHLLEVIDEVEGRGVGRVTAVRGDAGFPSDPLLSTLEERGVHYVFRLRSNPRLAALAKEHLRRPPGRPPNEPREWHYELEYQANSWAHPRRVVLVAVERPGELLLDCFFLVTSWAAWQKRGRTLLELYRQRGTLEKHLGEFQTVLDPRLSSTQRPKTHVRGRKPKTHAPPHDAEACNAATFRLFALAYNLLTSVRRVLGGRRTTRTGLARLRRRLLAVPARLVRTGRRATYVLNAATAHLWLLFLRRLDRLVPT